jgi:hypothetical protein
MATQKVKRKKVSWSALVTAKEKEKLNAPVVVYEFSNGRKFTEPAKKPSGY